MLGKRMYYTATYLFYIFLTLKRQCTDVGGIENVITVK